MKKKYFFPLLGAILGGISVILSGCESSQTSTEKNQERITVEELNAYCPKIDMADGQSYYNVYARGGTDNAEKIVYQPSITKVTRSCQYGEDGRLHMKAAAAGRIIPGPDFRASSITMPIRVTVMQGDQTIYSKLHKYTVKAESGSNAMQFIFLDDQIFVPKPEKQNLRVFIGFESNNNNH